MKKGDVVIIKEGAVLLKQDLKNHYNRYFPEHKGTVVSKGKGHASLRCRCKQSCDTSFDFYLDDLIEPNMLDDDLFEI
jgi:hypothetical protein